MASEEIDPFRGVRDARYITLTTFRKSGAAVPTPVWFAETDGRLVVYTSSNTGKVKRIRANARVTVAPCTARGRVTGPASEGVASLLYSGAAERAERATARTYGAQHTLIQAFTGLARLVGRRQGDAYSEIAPAR